LSRTDFNATQGERGCGAVPSRNVYTVIPRNRGPSEAWRMSASSTTSTMPSPSSGWPPGLESKQCRPGPDSAWLEKVSRRKVDRQVEAGKPRVNNMAKTNGLLPPRLLTQYQRGTNER